MKNQYDVIIIGAGVVGTAIARELSKFSITVAVIEKELDVSMGASSRNSGVLHSGIHYKPGTLRARLNVLGNSLMADLCNDLNVKINYLGKLTVAQDEEDVKSLYMLKDQGQANEVPGLEILDRDTMRKIQPDVGGIRALHSPSTGIVCPYSLTIALAENAYANDCHFYLGHTVTSLHKQENLFEINASGKRFHSKVLINSAGLYSADICSMLGIKEYKIYPCRGEYLILDKRLNGSLNVLVYPAPHAKVGGGIHLTKTVSGNILIGPSHTYQDDPEDYACTDTIMALLRKEGHELLPNLKTSDFIRSFSGLRAKQTPPSMGGFKDFVIESREDVKGFVNLVGIESPGLTSSPAIAGMVKDMVAKLLPLKKKDTFDGTRSGMAGYFYQLPDEQKADLVSQNPDYGEVVCRCEQITKKEVLDAISNPLGVIKTINGIKYRSRAMMGRCQGGFCLPRIVEILEKEFGYNPEDYLLKSKTSPLFIGKMRQEFV